MSFSFRPAVRANVPLIIGLAGPSGSGKTMSALRVARGLAGDQPFAVVDTESGRAQMYADHFQPWHHGDLAAPFTPERYDEAIASAETAGYGVIVVDSFSHEHAGDGGLLDMHEAELQRMAGDDWKKREAMKMAAWIKPKASHKRLVQHLLQLRSHLVVCLRAEQKVEIAKEDGKTVVRPKRSFTGIDGWIPICESRLPYELTVSLLMTPDKPGVPQPIKLPEDLRALVPLDRKLDEQVGVSLAEWAAGNAASVAPEYEPADQEIVDRLLELGGERGNRDQVLSAIEKHRAKSTVQVHARWLRDQLGRLTEGAAA